MNDGIAKIVVCGDKNIEIGLHITLYSLLSKSSCNYHKIYFINDGYLTADIDRIYKTLSSFAGRFEIIPIQCKSSSFDKLKGLHGNKFTYLKLLIAKLIDEDVVIYLDLDIVVQIDIMELVVFPMDGYTLAANPETTIGNCHERNIYLKENLHPESHYFNCGILLINLDEWRKDNITERCMVFANKYADYLQAADQSILNYYFNDNFKILPDRFNIRISNKISCKEYQKQVGILHFFGRPKPWDLFAEFIHPQYRIYKQVLVKTYFCDYKSYRQIDSRSLKKFMITYKSYIKTIFRL